MQAKQSDAQELTSGQASTMARNEQVIDTLTGMVSACLWGSCTSDSTVNSGTRMG